MSGWIIRERIASVAGLKKFAGMGYRYDETQSEPNQPVFVRDDSARNATTR